MLSLTDVKNYIKIDFSEDDVLILALIDASSEYLKNAINVNLDFNNQLVKLCQLMIIAYLYENRGFECLSKADDKVLLGLTSMCIQLGVK